MTLRVLQFDYTMNKYLFSVNLRPITLNKLDEDYKGYTQTIYKKSE